MLDEPGAGNGKMIIINNVSNLYWALFQFFFCTPPNGNPDFLGHLNFHLIYTLPHGISSYVYKTHQKFLIYNCVTFSQKFCLRICLSPQKFCLFFLPTPWR